MTTKTNELILEAARLGDNGNHHEAILLANQTLKTALPDECDAVLYERGFHRLLSKQFPKGWLDWEHRPSRLTILDSLAKCWPALPEWDGSPNQTVLVCAEKGLGDTILFARYLNTLWERNCKLQYVASLGAPSFTELISAYPGVIGTYSGDDPVPQIADSWIGIESLPLHCAKIPKPFRFPSVTKINTKPRLGICWHGSPVNVARDRQPYDLDLWSRLAVDGVELVSLQLGEQGMCHTLLPAKSNLLQTVLLMQSCDLVITMDTSVAHMAGSVGVETWMPLHQLNYWPWVMRDKSHDKTIWYPSMRIFRQDPTGWPATFDKMRAELALRFQGSH